jgi:hypothetical protein
LPISGAERNDHPLSTSNAVAAVREQGLILNSAPTDNLHAYSKFTESFTNARANID